MDNKNQSKKPKNRLDEGVKQVIRVWNRPIRKIIEDPNQQHINLDVFKPKSLEPPKFLRDKQLVLLSLYVKDINKRVLNRYQYIQQGFQYILEIIKPFKNFPEINEKRSYVIQNKTLDVKDINKQKQYSFISKRTTDPINPNYNYNFNQTNIYDNPISNIEDTKIPQLHHTTKIYRNYLDVKDITQQQNYSYKSKRQTDPMNPNYSQNFYSKIDNNIIAHVYKESDTVSRSSDLHVITATNFNQK